MERITRTGLHATIADLRDLSRRLERLLAESPDTPAREDLEGMRRQAETAISYYSKLVPPQQPEAIPDAVRRAAHAAVVPVGGIGLQVSGFSYEIPDSVESQN